MFRFPDPHLSHAKLPAIKKNTKTRMKTQYEELNPKELQKKLIEGLFKAGVVSSQGKI